MRLQNVIDYAEQGFAIARNSWQADEEYDDRNCPSFLVFIAARAFVPDREPMVKFVKKEMRVDDHFDAIYLFDDGTARSVLGYHFSQEDILADDWDTVDQPQFDI